VTFCWWFLSMRAYHINKHVWCWRLSNYRVHTSAWIWNVRPYLWKTIGLYVKLVFILTMQQYFDSEWTLQPVWYRYRAFHMVMSVILIINIHVYDKAFILQLNHIFMGQNQLEKKIFVLVSNTFYLIKKIVATYSKKNYELNVTI